MNKEGGLLNDKTQAVNQTMQTHASQASVNRWLLSSNPCPPPQSNGITVTPLQGHMRIKYDTVQKKTESDPKICLTSCVQQEEEKNEHDEHDNEDEDDERIFLTH